MTDELRWMPEVPFRYSMLGFRDFVMSRDLDESRNSDAASCFLGLVTEKLEGHPRHIMPIMPDLLPAIEHVARNQAAYHAEEHIYGNFLQKWERIKTLYAERGGIAYSNQLNSFLR
jgi:hypothetical protein